MAEAASASDSDQGEVQVTPAKCTCLCDEVVPRMDVTNTASAKGGFPLMYPTTPYTYPPGLYMYPPHPVAYFTPPPAMCLSPQAAMKGHDLYFSGQPRVPLGPTPSNVRNPWSYYGQPLVEGMYMMPPMTPAYPRNGYFYHMPQYTLPAPHQHTVSRYATPGTKVISIEDVQASENKDCDESSDDTSVSETDKSDEIVQDDTSQSDSLDDKGLKGDKKNIFKEKIGGNECSTKSSNEDKTGSSVNLSKVTSDKTFTLACTRNKTEISNCDTSKQKKGKQKSENVYDKLIQTGIKEKKVVGVSLHEGKKATNKACVSGASQTGERRKDYLRSREERTCMVQLKGIITEVHCSMGKLRIQGGKEYYFSRDMCFLYGVRLAHLELWHILIEGQQVKVTLNHINPELPKVTQVTVEEEDPDFDPDTIVLNMQQWCSINCVPEDATAKLIQQVKGLH